MEFKDGRESAAAVAYTGEIQGLASSVGGAELARAKAQLKAGLLMSLESSSARVEQMGRQMLSYGRLLSAEELIAEVEAVDVDKVKGFAARLTGRAPAVAIVGAGRRSGTHATKAHAQLSRLAGPPAAAVRKAPKAGR
jgi:predicted Zn-dependent peptidase